MEEIEITEFWIKVKVPNSDSSIPICVTNETKIKDIIYKVKDRFSKPEIQLKAVYLGKDLDPESTIEENEVKDGYTIQVFPKPETKVAIPEIPSPNIINWNLQIPSRRRVEVYVNRLHPDDPLISPIPEEGYNPFRMKVSAVCETIAMSKQLISKLQDAVSREDLTESYEVLKILNSKFTSAFASLSFQLNELSHNPINFQDPNHNFNNQHLPDNTQLIRVYAQEYN